MNKFKNLYTLLNISPLASVTQIKIALRTAAEKQTISLQDIQLCQKCLLIEENRINYDECLKQHYPDLFSENSAEELPKNNKSDGIIYQSQFSHSLDFRYDYGPAEKSKSPWKKLTLISILLIAIATISWAFANFMQGYDRNNNNALQLKNNILSGFSSLGKNQQIQVGMQEQQVYQIMGSQGETTSLMDSNFEGYLNAKRWYSIDGKSKTIVQFKDGKVIAFKNYKLE